MPPALSSKRKQGWAKELWVKAIKSGKIQGQIDPWARFHLEDMAVEKATRHVYHAINNTWTKNEVFIKIEDTPFDNGAMRVCYRM